MHPGVRLCSVPREIGERDWTPGVVWRAGTLGGVSQCKQGGCRNDNTRVQAERRGVWPQELDQQKWGEGMQGGVRKNTGTGQRLQPERSMFEIFKVESSLGWPLCGFKAGDGVAVGGGVSLQGGRGEQGTGKRG